jgi:hypothetical protein
MKSLKNLFPVCGLVLAALILGTGVASACTLQCVKVADPFCRRCLDVGTYTGATCKDSGSCGCFYTQNTCGLAASGIQPQTALATVTAPAGKGAVCSAPAAVDILPDVLAR